MDQPKPLRSRIPFRTPGGHAGCITVEIEGGTPAEEFVLFNSREVARMLSDGVRLTLRTEAKSNTKDPQ